MSSAFIVPLLRPLGVMSLAFAIFGAYRYSTEQTYPPLPNVPMDRSSVRPAPFEDACAEPHDQNNAGLSVHCEYTLQGCQFDEPAMSYEMKPSSPSDGPPHKRQRPATMIVPRKQSLLVPHESQQVALFPTQPASPPPDHLLRAGQHTGTSLVRLLTPVADQDCPTRAYNILRWVGYALLHGFHALGIDVVDGWAHLHQLAKAAVSDRKDLEGLIPGALRRVIEQDTTGRWMIVGDRVCKVPRHARRAVLPATPMDVYLDIRPRLCDVPAAVSPPVTQTLEMGVVACHCALSECVYHYSLLEKSLCQVTAPQ